MEYLQLLKASQIPNGVLKHEIFKDGNFKRAEENI